MSTAPGSAIAYRLLPMTRAILLLAAINLCAQTTEPVATLPRGAENSVTTMVPDAAGDLYVAGFTKETALPATNRHSESALFVLNEGRWTPLTESFSGELLSVAADPTNPSRIFVATPTSLARSTDGGITWREVRPPARIISSSRFVAIDPGNPRRVLSWTGAEMILSEDGGDTWSVVLGKPSATTHALRYDARGSGAIAVITSGGIVQASRDGGRTWASASRHVEPFLSLPADLLAATVDPHRSGGIYVSSAQAVYYSPNWGDKWQLKRAPAFFTDLLADPDRPGRLYGASSNGVYRSDDSGDTWRSLRAGTHSRVAYGCGTLYAFGRSGAFRSTDAGNTWTAIEIPAVNDISAGCTAFAARVIAENGFVAKYGRTGLLWLTYVRGTNRGSRVTSIAPDGSGGVIAGGITVDPVMGFSDAFVTRLDSGGRIVFTRTFGGERFEHVSAVAVDKRGYFYAAGYTNSAQFPVTSNATGRRPAPPDGFVVKFDGIGETVYSTLIGGLQYDSAEAIAVDAEDRAVVAGSTMSTDWPVLFGSPARPSGFVLRLNASGSAIEGGLYLDGTAGGLALGQDGTIHVTGLTRSTDFPVTRGAYSSRINLDVCDFEFNTGEIYAVAIDPQWRTRYSTLSGANCADQVQTVTTRRDGSLSIASRAAGAWMPAHGAHPAGRNMGFANFAPDGSRLHASGVVPGFVAGLSEDAVYYIDESRIYRRSITFSTGSGVDQIGNAFRERPTNVVPSRALLRITGSGLGPEEPVDLGLDRPNLPVELAGTRVLLNGRDCPIHSTGARRIVCATPQFRTGEPVTIQVEYQGRRLPTLTLPAGEEPALLNTAFPGPGFDAYAANQDGTRNSRDNPASRGSRITFYGTGLKAEVYLWWAPTVPVAATQLPGFAPGLMEMKTVVPAGARPGYNSVAVAAAGQREPSNAHSNVLTVWVK